MSPQGPNVAAVVAAKTNKAGVLVAPQGLTDVPEPDRKRRSSGLHSAEALTLAIRR
jgi:hypothetical protein